MGDTLAVEGASDKMTDGQKKDLTNRKANPDNMWQHLKRQAADLRYGTLTVELNVSCGNITSGDIIKKVESLSMNP